jgi:hypothetical protein
MSTDDELRAFKHRHVARLWQNPNVCGVDVADDAHGKPVLTVHLRSDEPGARAGLPTEIEGRPVTYLLNPIEKQRGSNR